MISRLRLAQSRLQWQDRDDRPLTDRLPRPLLPVTWRQLPNCQCTELLVICRGSRDSASDYESSHGWPGQHRDTRQGSPTAETRKQGSAAVTGRDRLGGA